ncbi:MAG: hypothetical protein WCL32_21340 [Planctomycetota bacterium]|jgi:hypothetical protein
MFASFDWMHGVALALGALAAVFFPKKSATGPAAIPGSPLAPGNSSAHPLFDTLLQVLEGKLTDLIHVEPGPNGEPMFTLRVVLVNDDKSDANKK